MKKVYPVIIYKKESEDGYNIVYVPDLNVTTQGETIVESIEMARDLIGIVGMDYLEDNKEIPEPFKFKEKYPSDFDSELKIEYETLVDIDFMEYKKKLENKAVKKTLTIPYYLNEKAEKAGVNFSRVLKEALEEMLV